MQTASVDGDKQNNTRAENIEEVIREPQSNTTHVNQLNQPANTFLLEREKDNTKVVNQEQQANKTHANQLNQPAGTFEVEKQKPNHFQSSQRKQKANFIAETSEETSEFSDKAAEQDGIFKFTAEGKNVMVDVGKQKLLEEIIRKEKKEAEASHYEAFKVLEEDARFNAARISEEVGENHKQLLDQYRAKKNHYDWYVKAMDPNCRHLPEKITSVDIVSKKGPIIVTIHREGWLKYKTHRNLCLRDFNAYEWEEIRQCINRKISAHAKTIMSRIEAGMSELRPDWENAWF